MKPGYLGRAARWAITVCGIVLWTGLIWFFGPLLGFAGQYPFESVRARLVVIGVVVSVFVIALWWRDRRPRHRRPARNGQKVRQRLTWGFHLTVWLLTALSAAGLLVSYENNRRFVADVDRKIAEIDAILAQSPPSQGDVKDYLPVLNVLRDLPGGYARHDKSVPLTMSFGLYQGDKLGGVAEQAYRSALRDVLVPRLMRRLERQIGEERDDPARLYDTLRAYLMLAAPERRDDSEMIDRILADSQAPRPRTEEDKDFGGHVRALFERRFQGLPPNAALVASAREKLAAVSLPDLVYERMKLLLLNQPLPDWRLSDILGSQQLTYFRRPSGRGLSEGVPGLFTRNGYRDFFLPELRRAASAAIDSAWILGTEPTPTRVEANALERQVADLYYADYIRAWQNLLADLTIAQQPDIEHETRMVGVMSGSASPIKTILGAVSEQTSLAGRDMRPAESGILSKLGRTASAVAARRGGEEDEPRDDSTPVDVHFQPIHNLINADGRGSPPIHDVLASLDPLYKLLFQAVERLSGGHSPSQADRDEFRENLRRVSEALRAEAFRQPEPLRAWLLAFVTPLTFEVSTNLDQGLLAARINAAWSTSVLPECLRTVQGVYPLDADSPNDIPLGDFVRFFSPVGILQTFFKDYIAPNVDTSTRPWRWRFDAGDAIGLSLSSLRLFENAAAIRDAFFPAGGAEMRVQFQVQPISLDSNTVQVELEVGDQRLDYRHGLQVSVTFQWPTTGRSGARIVFQPIGEDATPRQISGRGDWGLFILLDQAKLSAISPDRLRATFRSGASSATLGFNSASAANPLNLPALRAFSCPARL